MENIKKFINKEKALKLLTILVYTIMVVLLTIRFQTIFLKNKKMIAMNKEILLPKADNNIDKNVQNIQYSIGVLKEIAKKKFVGNIDQEKLRYETLKGFIKGLGDKYSEYLTKDDMKKLLSNLNSTFEGIGAYLEKPKDHKGLLIVKVIENSPAQKAGLKDKDLIVNVDNKDVTNLDIDSIIKLIKGKENTIVKLKVIRNKQLLEFNVKRGIVKQKNVLTKDLKDGVFMIRIATFSDTIAQEFKKEYYELRKKGMKKLVLDLRANTGGDVSNALEILDMFLPKKSVELITKDHNGKLEKIYSKKDGDKIDIALLTDELSASASEIVVAALKDNNRAKIIGKKTFGKGVIQTLIPIEGGDVLKLTTEEYIRPNGEKINKIGINPDYYLQLDFEKFKNGIDNQAEFAKEILLKKKN